MNKRPRLTWPMLFVALAVLACRALIPQATPTPTAVPPTEMPTPSPKPSSTPVPKPTDTPVPTTSLCNPNDELESLQSLVDYDEFVILHNIFKGERTLVLWFVDPELDPLAKGDALTDNVMLAVEHSIVASHRLKAGNDCLEELFDFINPIVVDGDYNGWFSGRIPPDELPDGESPSREELLETSFDPGYLREVETSPVSRQPAPPAACSWPEAREKAHMHFASSRPNVDFYFVIDEVGVNVWAQWASYLTPMQGEWASPLNVAMEVACLHPPLDWLWMFVVGEDGTVNFLGRVPGDAVRSDDPADVVNKTEVMWP